MGKKSKKKSSRHVKRKPVQEFPEDRRSLAFTVAWMMCTLATMGALVLYAIALFVATEPDDPKAFNPGELISGMALLTSVVTGTLALAVIPIVYRVRETPPPLPVTLGSALVAASPWLIVFVNAFVS